MNYNRGNIFSSLPPVTKNLLIINVVLFIITYLAEQYGYLTAIPNYLTLWNFHSDNFNPVQLVTYMFMHGSLTHLFFNMFGVLMFGRVLEGIWGAKKYLMFYLVTGIGAAVIHMLITYFQIAGSIDQANVFFMDPTAENFWAFLRDNGDHIKQFVFNFADDWIKDPDNPAFKPQADVYVKGIIEMKLQARMVGASGALMGLLVAFAMLFPNVELMIIFLPIPIKAKYFVPFFALLDLTMGVANFQWDNIAHFAHLGGAIVGFFIVRYWKNNQFNQY